MLVFVGAKMLLNDFFGDKVVPTEVALLITAMLIGGSMLVSVLKTRELPKAAARTERCKVGCRGASATARKRLRSGKKSDSGAAAH